MNHQLFCDGGVVGRNPSVIGGTFAWRWVVDGNQTREGYHFITCEQARMKTIECNLSEMMALVKGISQLPDGWEGEILSDSKNTLGRVFLDWKWNGVPDWLWERYDHHSRRINLKACVPVQLDGHPTKTQLLSGVGKRGNPVSVHNVWCDKACRLAYEEYLKTLEALQVASHA